MNNLPSRWSLRRALAIVFCAMLCCSALAAPANDNFADAERIIFGQPQITGSNLGATREPGEPNHADNAGGASVWWKITTPEFGYLTLSTLNSISTNGFPLDTLIAVYRGSDVANLQPIAANDEDNETGQSTSRLVLPVAAEVEYYIAVDGWVFEDIFGPDQGQIILDVSFSKNPFKPAAPWQLPDADGKIVKSSDFADRVVLLNFWATWCPPCVAEIPELGQLQDKYRDRGLTVIGISIDDPLVTPPRDVENFVRQLGVSYPILLLLVSQTDGRAVEDAYGPLPFIPTTVIIDRKNNIVRRIVGAHSFADFESLVLPLLADPLEPPDSPVGGDEPRPENIDDVTLRVSRAGGKVILEWPTLQARVEAQYTDRLPAVSWTSVTQIGTAGNETTSLSLDEGALGGARFFRLQIYP